MKIQFNLVIYAYLFSHCGCIENFTSNDSKRYKSHCLNIDVRYDPRNLKSVLENCRIISGSVRISNMINAKSEDFSNIKFPKLVEIDDYLYIDSVNGIETLKEIFPNLSVIRGKKLFNGFSIVIKNSHGLKEIGLDKLGYIGNGNASIHNNSNLCVKNNAPSSFNFRIDYADNKMNCSKEDDEDFFKNLFKSKSIECYNGNCLGGCDSFSNCNACKYFYLENGTNFTCLKYQNSFRYLKITERFYIQAENCNKIQIEEACTNYCPLEIKHFLNKTLNQCNYCADCKLKSCGKIKIQKPSDIHPIDCDAIDELEILNLNDIDGDLDRKLYENFHHILEIRKHLIVENSSALNNLNFLRNLQIIGSSNKSLQALMIKTNSNLQEIFKYNQKILIKGPIIIQSNALLCNEVNSDGNVDFFHQKIKQQPLVAKLNVIQKFSCYPTIKSRILITINSAIIELEEPQYEFSYELRYQQVGSMKISGIFFENGSCEIFGLEPKASYTFFIHAWKNNSSLFKSHRNYFKMSMQGDKFLIFKNGKEIEASYGNIYHKFEYQTPPTIQEEKTEKSQIPFVSHILFAILTILLIINFLTKMKRKFIRKREITDQNVEFIKEEIPNDLSYIYVDVTHFDQHEKLPNSILKSTQIGNGRFSNVFKGYLKQTEITTVVLKVFNIHEIAAEVKFKNEIEIIKNLKHRNIVKFHGYKSLKKPHMIIYECMKNNLQAFLVQKRSERKFEEIPSMTKMSLDIAEGLNYLAKQKIIHCNLTAENCLIGNDLVVKISDFKMSHKICQSEFYKLNESDKNYLPVRWMSPESIRTSQFTYKSDTWSYGIVLWEIATFGRIPYENLTDSEVVVYVKSGKTLPFPNGCSFLYQLMLKCWNLNAKERISITNIINYLKT